MSKKISFSGSALVLLYFLYVSVIQCTPHHLESTPLENTIFPRSQLLKRTNRLTLVYASLQCFPTVESGGDEDLNKAAAGLIETYLTFDPEAYLDLYKNPKDVQALLSYINNRREGFEPDGPFTNSPEHISQLTLIMNVLFPNADNFQLFYNTTVWLLERVNSAQLYWSLSVVVAEKFADSVIAPTIVEVFPQLYINKNEIEKIAGLNKSATRGHPLQYWTSDPGLNEFHGHWHIENPFWWNTTKYEGIVRHRRGELFLYMHHQIVARYTAELYSNGIPDSDPIELNPEYVFPEPYFPDIINVNYKEFPIRKEGEKLKEFDDEKNKSIQELKIFFDRLWNGIEQMSFAKPDGSPESLQYENGTDILGNSVESSTVYSANLKYYGSFHNYLHRLVGDLSRPNSTIPGVEAHAETSMRDPVFFRIHTKVDTLYSKLKSQYPAYTKNELDFPGVSIKSLEIQTPKRNELSPGEIPDPWKWTWPGSNQYPTITTYFTTETYDISTAARPCRGVSGKSTYTQVRILTHDPFKYNLVLKSTRNEVAYGMVRIFLLPEFRHDGKKLDVEDSHHKAIELDRFRVEIEPGGRETIISRSSLNSSLTRLEPPPGIKALFKASKSSGRSNNDDNNNNNEIELAQDLRRACGFPNNLLIPRGTKEGMRFKLILMVSEEDEEGGDYTNFPICGALNGQPYPDKRAMGFPFDRRGTRFVSYEGIWGLIGGYAYKNVKEMRIIVKHREN